MHIAAETRIIPSFAPCIACAILPRARTVARRAEFCAAPSSPRENRTPVRDSRRSNLWKNADVDPALPRLASRSSYCALEFGGKDGDLATTRYRSGPRSLDPGTRRSMSTLEQETDGGLSLTRRSAATTYQTAPRPDRFPPLNRVATGLPAFLALPGDPEFDPLVETERGTTCPSRRFLEPTRSPC
jgi:hypothetical protein